MMYNYNTFVFIQKMEKYVDMDCSIYALSLNNLLTTLNESKKTFEKSGEVCDRIEGTLEKIERVAKVM